ncbi:MAG TPA: helix-turn-helix domain-containing protein [Pseudonocardiaceae bacterium]|jgi:sugar diacid utilization regulator|nr:helix-turn-helix domain-containing protein [Pseudonocardiaceae bacterium]
MVSVRAVAAMAELRLTVRAGQRALDRPVSRIYGTELPDPARFLAGGELVLSGLLWLRTDADVPRFVAALAEAGVAALIACDADTGVLPPALVEQCRRRGVPLLEGAPDLSFAVITDRVGLALAGEQLGAGRRRRLVAAVAGGTGLTELLAIGAAELGGPCWVLTPLGRVVAAAGPAPAPARLTRLVGEFFRRSRPGDSRVLPIDDPTGPRLTQWFLAWPQPVPPTDETVAELVDLVGVYRFRQRESRAVANRMTGPVLTDVLAGTAGPAELAATARAVGLDLDRPVRVLALAAPDSLGLPVLAELVDLLAPADRVGALGVAPDRGYALLPAADESDADLADRARAALRLVEPGLAGDRLVLGISSVVGPAEVRAAMQEAGHAVDVGLRRTGRTEVVAGAEVAVHQLLLAGVPGELRAALRRRLLGPVLDYDHAHGAELLDTLRVFLDCSGSWSKAAARLHLHVNTLHYRIGRVEELAGVDLSDFTQRVDVYLALRA